MEFENRIMITDVRFLKKTKKAVLVLTKDNRKIWIPFSLLIAFKGYNTNGWDISIPEWFAKKVGLVKE